MITNCFFRVFVGIAWTATSLLGHQFDTYGWKEFVPDEVPTLNSGNHLKLGIVKASSIIAQPVYMTMTTIDARMETIAKNIASFLEATMVPDRIYLFISSEKYLLDKGVQKIPQDLIELSVRYPVSIVFTRNLGPHRKLLPLLSSKWEEDCVIITVDDDNLQDDSNRYCVEELIKNYVATNRSSVVALKARRIGFCDRPPHKTLMYQTWATTGYGRHEMLLLPTGNGGILYRPRFFSPLVFDGGLFNLTTTADDIMFRLSTLVQHIPVVTGCRPLVFKVDGEPVTIRCPTNVTVASPYPHSPFDTSLAIIPGNRHTRGGGGEFGRSHHYGTNFSATATGSSSSRRLVNAQGQQSLFLHYNRNHGNDRAWSNAIAYLREKGFDFDKFVPNYLAAERPHCLKNAPNEDGRSEDTINDVLNKRCAVKDCSGSHMNALAPKVGKKKSGKR